jgi:hypothetical protein
VRVRGIRTRHAQKTVIWEALPRAARSSRDEFSRYRTIRAKWNTAKN